MKRLVAFLIVLAGSAAVACYQDDSLHPAAIAPTKVFLTDAPFPYDSVSSVNIYVARIEASPIDTAPEDRLAGRMTWVEVAAPRKAFNLLSLQQGAKELLGQATLDAGQYTDIRMTIDVDLSTIKYLDGSDALVHWPGHGEILVYAGVAERLPVSATGAEIVIDFDVGSSFDYYLFSIKEFNAHPVLRAVNAAATGAIAGTVTAPGIGSVANANITVYGGDAVQPASQWYVVATGRTNTQGQYKIAFLSAGAYIVRVEQPDLPAFSASTTPSVQVSVGQETAHNVTLTLAGSGSTFLNVTGPATVGVGGTIVLRAAVGDSAGNPVANPMISWRSRDSSIALLLDSSYADTLQFVLGLQPGTTWIVATSPTFLVADSVSVQVVSDSPSTSNPVASVTVTPPTLSLIVGDSTFLQAVLRDSSGIELTNRQVFWFQTDSSSVVDLLVNVGPTAVLKARHSGSTIIRAESEGKAGSASITVQ